VFGPLSAFPVTPLHADRLDARGVHALVRRAVEGGADSIGALGSTGGYPYLSRADRRRVAELSVAAPSRGRRSSSWKAATSGTHRVATKAVWSGWAS
jgi:dihydrodipicolinate synthase/N-acetylneuraminate lyase